MTVEKVKELLKQSSYAYLASEEGEWLDYEKVIHKIEEMTKEELENCIALMKDQKKNIERGNFAGGADYNQERYAHMIAIAQRLYLNKLEELEERKRCL